MNVMTSWEAPPLKLTCQCVASMLVKLRTGAVADEAQRIARPRAVAGEVHDGVAVGLPDVEHEGVVAGVAGEDVGAALTVEHVVAGIAEDAVGERVADAVEIGAALQHQRLDVRRKAQS